MKSLTHMTVTEDWQIIAHQSSKESVGQLIDLYDILNDKYNAYTTHIESHETPIPPSELLPHKDLLVDYYENPPTELKKIIQHRRNNHQLTSCPFCGNPFSPDTLDHFMPKEHWPEYSIYGNNLIPQCSDCAPIKGSFYYCETQKIAFFISPIFSEILSKISFGVMATPSKDIRRPKFTPKFWIHDLQEADIKRARIHLEKLKVKERFVKYCNDAFSRWENLITNNRFDIRTALNQRVLEQNIYDGKAQDWETAFCIGLLANDEIINYLNSLSPSATTKTETTTNYVVLEI